MRFFFFGKWAVLIFITLTSNKYSIADLIVGLSDLGSTTKLYWLFASNLVALSVIIGYLIISLVLIVLVLILVVLV